MVAAARFIFTEINNKPSKVQISDWFKNKDPNITVLEYLETIGIHAGRIPRQPDFR